MSDTLKTVKIKSRKNKAYTNINNQNIIPALISKPEQGKKTIEMSLLLNYDLINNKHILNFYITPNRKNQANQAENTFTTYMEFFKNDKHMAKHIAKIDVLHANRCNTRDPDGFVRRANVYNKRLIIALSNKSRLSIVFETIVKWIKSNNTNICKIYIDEAGDPSALNSILNHVWGKLEEQIYDLNKVKLILIDAHCRGIMENKLFKKYFPRGTLEKTLNQYNLDNYMFFSSLPCEIHEWIDMSSIIDSYKKKDITFQYNDYILLPLSYKKDEQYEEASEFVESVENSVVLIINGDGYHIFTFNSYNSSHLILPKKSCGKTRNCMKETCPKCFPDMAKEINVVKLIKKKFASNKLFCLGGNHCIDRAMTFHEPGFEFTKALITKNLLNMGPFMKNTDYESSSISKKESVSQRVKRICHSFGNGKQATYYGPKEIYDGICQLEHFSTSIADKAGYITPNTIDQMDEGLNPSLETAEEIEELELVRNPVDYCLKTFESLRQGDVDTIHKKLNKFKNNISIDTDIEKNVHKKTITTRIKKNYKEPDDKLAHLSLRDYEENISTLSIALEQEKTSSRVRVTRDEYGNIIWLIHYLTPKNKIFWNKVTYNLISIAKDGNCLFNSFVRSGVLEIDTIKQMRRKVCNELRNNQAKYDKRNFEEDDWDDECDKIKKANNWNDTIFDYCLSAISELYDINITIFVYETLKCGGYKMIYDKPIIIPEQQNKSKKIYLRKLDDHYDLLTKL